MAGFKRGYTVKEKANKKITQNDFVSKAPSGRELDFAKQKTEGERVMLK